MGKFIPVEPEKWAEMVKAMAENDRLKAEVAREKRAEMIAQGLGDPRRLYVRFQGVS